MSGSADEQQINERITKARRSIDLVEQFMKDIEQVGGEAPPHSRMLSMTIKRQ
jgi:hypothetical protein